MSIPASIPILAFLLCFIAAEPLMAQARPKVLLDLNKADVPELAAKLPAVGKQRAASILAYRRQHGLFRSYRDLAKVRGLGKFYVRRHRQRLQKICIP